MKLVQSFDNVFLYPEEFIELNTTILDQMC